MCTLYRAIGQFSVLDATAHTDERLLAAAESPMVRLIIALSLLLGSFVGKFTR